MATMTQDELYRTFLEVSGQQTSALSDVSMTLAGVLAQVQEVGASSLPPRADAAPALSNVIAEVQGMQASTPAIALSDAIAEVQGMQASTPAPSVNSPSTTAMTLSDVIAQVQEMQASTPAPNVKTPSTTASSQGTSGGDTLSSVASTVLKSGFGLAPLVSGLISLFSGDDTPAPAPLLKYALPAAISFQAAESAGGTTGLDYDQSGMPRSYSESAAAGSSASGGAATAAPAPQITVNVQAMDARSFLDRSNEIALAVRDAMLNMNAINDVVNEL